MTTARCARCFIEPRDVTCFMKTFAQEPVGTSCPYCGEPIELLVDTSIRKQHYIEDCEVCCKPITVRVTIDSEGYPEVQVSGEDDV